MNYKPTFKKIRSSKIVLFVSPLVIYLIAAYLLWGPDHFSDIHRLFFIQSGDSQLFSWALNWWPFSISHGLNPFVEKYVFYPAGYNLAWSTSVATLGLLMAPFTAIWGAVTSFNILVLTGIPLSALSCFYLVYFICKKYWAALLCGAVYGFSTFQVAQLLGHPCFYVNFVPPLLVLLVMLRFNNRLRKIPFILILGLLLAMQFGISSEAFASMMIFGVITWILVLIFAGKKLQPKLFKTSLELILGILVALVILSPFIYYAIVGYGSVPKVNYPPVGYSADLLNFILPTKITLIGGKTFLHISSRFTANTAEQGAYLTIPLVLFMISFSIYYWRKWYVKVLAIMSVVIATLSLGPRLNVNGVRGSVALPEAIFTKLPLLRSMLPMRFATYMFLVAAVMLGFWFSFNTKKLTKKKTSIVSILKYALVTIVVILLLPQSSNYWWQAKKVSWEPDKIPNFLSSNEVSKYIGLHQNVLFLPYNIGYDPEFWQEYSGMKFTTSNGYLAFVPSSVTATPTEFDLYNDIPQANFEKNFIVFCQTHHVSEIIYARYSMRFGPVELREVRSLNWPSSTVEKFVIIKVPKADQ